jgi:hypothetical protein
VELIVSSTVDGPPNRVPCIYFERFKNGRLVEPKAHLWELLAIPVLAVGAVIAALAWLVW